MPSLQFLDSAGKVVKEIRLVNSGELRALRSRTDSNRPRPIRFLSGSPVPFVAHQARHSKEPINAFAISASPECKHPAKGGVCPAVVAAIVGYIAGPKLPKTKATLCTERPFDQGGIG